MLRTYSQDIQQHTIESAFANGLFIAEEVHDLANKLESITRGITGQGIQLSQELPVGTVTIPNVNLYDQLLGREVHSHDKPDSRPENQRISQTA